MTGQAYSARSEPNYRHWAVGGLFALGLIGSLWYACRSPAKAPALEEVALEESRPPVAIKGLGREDLVARLNAANAKLSQSQSALDAAGEKIGQLNDQVARFRRESEGRGEYFPPPSTDVRNIGGGVIQAANGEAWIVEGEWFNLGETRADGNAEFQLRINGKAAGEVLKVRIGPIFSGARYPYRATLPRVPGDDRPGLYVSVHAVWSQL